MNDIEPRPWEVMGEQVAVSGSPITRGRRIVDSRAALAHAVACVNALHFAGITPEALAADPECVRKLVEAARDAWHGLRYVRQAHGDLYGVGFDRVDDKMTAALRACGIEVKP